MGRPGRRVMLAGDPGLIAQTGSAQRSYRDRPGRFRRSRGRCQGFWAPMFFTTENRSHGGEGSQKVRIQKAIDSKNFNCARCFSIPHSAFRIRISHESLARGAGPLGLEDLAGGGHRLFKPIVDRTKS